MVNPTVQRLIEWFFLFECLLCHGGTLGFPFVPGGVGTNCDSGFDWGVVVPCGFLCGVDPQVVVTVFVDIAGDFIEICRCSHGVSLSCRVSDGCVGGGVRVLAGVVGWGVVPCYSSP